MYIINIYVTNMLLNMLIIELLTEPETMRLDCGLKLQQKT